MEQQENELEQARADTLTRWTRRWRRCSAAHGRGAQGGRINKQARAFRCWMLPGRRLSWQKTARCCRTRRTPNSTRTLSATPWACPARFNARVLATGPVAYQGVEGAFSHIALTRLFHHARAQAYPTWAQVFDAVAGGDAAYGVLPFENSHAGDVSEVLDLCFAHREICACSRYTICPSARIFWAFRARSCGGEKGGVPSAGAAAVGKVHPHAGAGDAALPAPPPRPSV